MSSLKSAKQHLLLSFSPPHTVLHKTGNSMATLISQSCDKLQPSFCLSRGYGAIWRWPECLWTSDKPQKQATAKNFQNQYMPALLVHVYSYRLMVKSLPYWCVCGHQPFLKSSHVCIMRYMIQDKYISVQNLASYVHPLIVNHSITDTGL